MKKQKINPINQRKAHKLKVFNYFRMFPSDFSGSLDVCFSNLVRRKVYKLKSHNTINNLQIVSMIPGDREVAGCFNFFDNFGGVF